MNRAAWTVVSWVGLSALLVATTLWLRPIMPIDETRYLTVAWEMHLRGDWLVPHLNGAAYSHKPPLMFWLFNLGWWLFGVNDIWPRLVNAGFALGSLLLVWRMGLRLWPEGGRDALASGWILLGMPIWGLYASGLVLFDILIACFTLVTLTGVLRVARAGGGSGWLIAGAGIGLGILAKGPVILVYTLPVMLTAPWWVDNSRGHIGWARWYLGVLGAVALGAAIALAWALPAAWKGGEEYARAILWGQTAGRMAKSFAHQRPFWWYMPLLPLVLYPWFWWGPVWRSWAKTARAMEDHGVRFLLAWLLPAFLIFCLISGKQVHYLVPLLPPFALLTAYLLGRQEGHAGRTVGPGLALTATWGGFMAWRWFSGSSHVPAWAAEIPWWGDGAVLALGMTMVLLPALDQGKAVSRLSVAGVAWLVLVHLAVIRPAAPWYDLRGISRHLAQLQAQGIPIAHVGNYRGEYQFLGRLSRPLHVVPPRDALAWLERHAGGRLVAFTKDVPDAWPLAEEFRQHHRAETVAVYHAKGGVVSGAP